MMALAGRVRPVTLRAACCGRASPSWCRVPGRDGTGSARQPPAKRVVTAAARRAQAWPAPEVRSLPRGERQLAWASRRAWSVCTVTGVSSGHVRGLRSGELETWSGLHNASLVTGSSLPVPGTCGSQHGNHHELGNYILGGEPVSHAVPYASLRRYTWAGRAREGISCPWAGVAAIPCLAGPMQTRCSSPFALLTFCAAPRRPGSAGSRSRTHRRSCACR